ncbi:MAG: NAD(+) diphosphatase [Anaerolineales bacterium]|nr:NAD(+) diphosphatase [Anaerolineales bacterium]
MTLSFTSLVTPPTDQGPDKPYWFIFKKFGVLVYDNNGQLSLPRLHKLEELGETAASTLLSASVSDTLLRRHYMGYINTDPPIHCIAAELPEDAAAPAGMTFLGLRQLYGRIPDDLLWLAGRAVQIIDWDRTHQFCSRCGTPPDILPHERAKKCPNCGFTTYPRLAPAVIVRIDRMINGVPHLLLARNHRFPRGFYSVIAGFVEPGETLEDCVHREIKEEVGINVKEVRYFGSQPWPFPHSLMIAYTAVYAAGDLTLEEAEINDAQWFTADNLPSIPPRMSIARRLIDDFVENYGD